MPDVLSQSQIDEMLRSFSSGSAEVKTEPQKADEILKNYDFKTPKKFTKEQLKMLDSIFENFARITSSFLSSQLRMFCRVELMTVEEQKYYEFNNALPDNVLMGMFDFTVVEDDDIQTAVIVQFSNPMTFGMIDRLLGGSGDPKALDRNFTDIELSLLEEVMGGMAPIFKESWAGYIDLDIELSGMETNSRVVQNIGIDDAVIIIMMEIELRSAKHAISVCIPALQLEDIMAKFGAKYSRQTKRMGTAKEMERKESIMLGLKESELTVTAVLAERVINLHDILNLQYNDIIPLGKHIDADATVMIGDIPWFDGKIGILNKNKAVRIDSVHEKS